MSTLLDATCEDSEELFDEHPELDVSSARCGSESIPRLLFVELEADFFKGRWPHPFAFLEEVHGLEDVLFGRLLDEDEVTVDAAEAEHYLEQCLRLLRQNAPEIPPVYSFSSPGGELYSELSAGDSLRAQAGFDHCVLIDDQAGTARDLRGQAFLDTPSGRLKILPQSVDDYCRGDVEALLRVARTARKYGRRLVLTVT